MVCRQLKTVKAGRLDAVRAVLPLVMDLRANLAVADVTQSAGCFAEKERLYVLGVTSRCAARTPRKKSARRREQTAARRRKSSSPQPDAARQLVPRRCLEYIPTYYPIRIVCIGCEDAMRYPSIGSKHAAS